MSYSLDTKIVKNVSFPWKHSFTIFKSRLQLISGAEVKTVRLSLTKLGILNHHHIKNKDVPFGVFNFLQFLILAISMEIWLGILTWGQGNTPSSRDDSCSYWCFVFPPRTHLKNGQCLKCQPLKNKILEFLLFFYDGSFLKEYWDKLGRAWRSCKHSRIIGPTYKTHTRTHTHTQSCFRLKLTILI